MTHALTRAAGFALAALCFLAVSCPAQDRQAFPPLYRSAGLFEQALDSAVEQAPESAVPITGLTLPHHLLAADLAALGLARARGQDVRRVVILGPDHYRRGQTPVSVSRNDFRTCCGDLAADTDLSAALLASNLVSESTLFSQEHAVQALLPLVALLFPQARVTALALSVNMDQSSLDELAEALKQGLAPDGVRPEHVLVIQSTDFSHYLLPAEAAARDRQSLQVLALGDPAEALRLDQPRNIDSRGALYVQMRLQQELFGASCSVLMSRNSQHYAQEPVVESTSYVAAEWAASGGDGWAPAEVETWVFGGDFFCGRHLAARAADPDGRRALARELLGATRGAPMVLNLEGPLAAACPEPSGPAAPWFLCMDAAPALDLLGLLNVRAAGVANNHARDLGDEGSAQTLEFLDQAGIAALAPGRGMDMGPFRLVAFTDLDNNPEPARNLLGDADWQALDAVDSLDGGKPLVAMVHWGQEYRPGMDARQEFLARKLMEHGVDLVVGAHSHCAGGLSCSEAGCVMASLGNFLFDQAGERVSGKLLRVRFFPQGTFALQVLVLKNVYAGP